jgi:hypothetical protein
MFIPAHELLRMPSRDVFSTDYDYYAALEDGTPLSLRDDDEIHYQKLEEAEKTGLHASIRDQGVHTPVHLAYVQPNMWDSVFMGGTPRGKKILFLQEGHHRVSAAHDIDENMEIPVTYFEDDTYL